MISRPLSPLEAQIVELLADGAPRTASEIVSALSLRDMTAQRQMGRAITKVLPALRSRLLVQRLMYGVETAPGRYQYLERYVAADTICPVCLTCWRTKWSMEQPPPQVAGFPNEACSLCGRRTNHGAYVPVVEVKALQT